jgi:acyl-CoA thioesterase
MSEPDRGAGSAAALPESSSALASASSMPADLAADTRPQPRGDGRYTVDLPASWSFLLPSGGVLATAALRAAALELADPRLRLISTTTTFCTPVPAGVIELEVVVLRRGNAASQVRVHARPSGAADGGLETIATFARERSGPDVVGARPPAVPPPERCPPSDEVRAPFFANLECRRAAGSPLRGHALIAGPARYARWFRYRVPQLAGAWLDRLALLPLADTMPAALTQAIGPGPYRYFAPSLDLTVQIVDDTEREWVLVASRVRRARAGWAIGEAELWDDAGRLLAIASQAMYVRTVVGEPPFIDASARDDPAGRDDPADHR